MKTIYITVGIPGSGKTTWTKEFLKSNPSFFRISRDEIRKSFCVMENEEYHRSKQYETIRDIVLQTEKQQLELLFSKGYDIVVDNTNSNLRDLFYIFGNAASYDYNINFVLFNTDFLLAKERIKRRDKTKDLFFMYNYKSKIESVKRFIIKKFKDYNIMFK